eukprot:356887-Chlamydomonas_euryale.AAC.1
MWHGRLEEHLSEIARNCWAASALHARNYWAASALHARSGGQPKQKPASAHTARVGSGVAGVGSRAAWVGSGVAGEAHVWRR